MTIRTILLLVLTGLLLAGCVSVDVGSDDNGRDNGSDKPAGDESPKPPTSSTPPSPPAPPPPSDAPAPSDTAGTGGGWTDVLRDLGRIAGEVTLDAEQGVLLTAYDTLAYPDQPVNLTARLQTGDTLQSVQGAELSFRRDGEQIAQAQTNADGFAIAEWTPPDPADYPITVVISAVPNAQLNPALSHSAVPMLVSARQREAQFVVVDLDHTVVDSSFYRVLLGGATPMADSAAVLDEVRDQYSLIYLTHRPDLLGRRSKNWLLANGYPYGPLLVSDWEGVLAGSGEFKTAKLSEIREVFPNVMIGIGDKISDAQSYADNGMTAYLLPHYDGEDPRDMRETADEIRALRGDIRVVWNWRQIRQGIFEDRRFPADAYADWLDDQADRVARGRDK